jgi:hypothetical protein
MIRLFLSITIISLIFPSSIVWAISPGNLNSLYQGSLYYEPQQTCGSNSNNVAPGTGSPNGLTFPDLNPSAMASAIDTWINQVNPNSEMKGLGSTIVADAQHSNVSPFLIVSIAREESSLADPSDFNVIHANNSFGRTADSSQPSFQGSMLWYKWSSVKASVDYTAPENQNIPGGGDFGSYLRDEFGTIINTNNYLAMMSPYAPTSGGNNVNQYVANLQTWITQLVSLTNGGGSTSSLSSNPSNSCSSNINCSSSSSGISSNQVAQQVVCIAQQELALWDSQPGYTSMGGPQFSYAATGYLKYSQNNHEEWCADFVSWVYNQAGYPLQPDPNWRVSSVSGVQAIGEENQQFQWHPSGSNYTPQPGDIQVHGGGHVNIVVAVNNNTLTLIGGDQGNGPYPGGSVVSEYTDTNFYGGPNGITGYVSPN